MVFHKLGKLLRGKLLTPHVQQDDGMRRPSAHLLPHFQQRRLAGECHSFNVGIIRKPLQVVSGEGLNGGVPGLANPGNLDLDHLVPEAMTTSALKCTPSFPACSRRAACTSSSISGHFSAGTRSSIARNGTETDRAESHNSSGPPGQFP